MRVLALFGPTAAGKSALALELAGRLGGEIVSCDAMQLYRGLPILTNQPTAADTARVPHHLVAIWGLEHEGSVAEYAGLAHAAIDDVLDRGRVPIVVGGSGLYLRAALAPLRLPPAPPPGLRDRTERIYDRLGPERAHRLLARRDRTAAEAVHPNDRKRVVRALELVELGESLSPPESELWRPALRHPTALFGLEIDPGKLAARIEQRVDAMFAAGVEGEVRRALSRHRPSATAARIHGLQDAADLIAGRIDEPEARRRLIVRTRRYAKRQRVWMRRIESLVPVADAAQLLRRWAA